MIKSIILDIDGVIVGGMPGFNFPIPHADVIDGLRSISKKGIAVSFCTAKPGFVISELVALIGLDAIHISNGGAELVNYSQNTVIDIHIINQDSATLYVSESNKMGLYTEAYTSEGYAIEKGAFCKLTEINMSILNKAPSIVPSLVDFVRHHEIVKIMPAAFTPNDKQRIESMMANYPSLALQWGGNPMYAPTLFGVVTKKGVTKNSAIKELSTFSGVPLGEMLGIGDGESDWEFMQLCGFVGTVENADKRVKEKVRKMGTFGYIGRSVDENGVLDVLKQFGVI